ncbi:MAG: hypothetical protein ACW99F_11785 [Candidatus Hodarchaeales archaeon]|jgi:uncharacterized repeat protein (TIGR01451 family)
MRVILERSQTMNFIVISFLLIIILTSYSLNSVSASPSNVASTQVNFPSLFVVKTVDYTEIDLGESFIVTVIIRNIGNQTAFNITFIDDVSVPWVFEVTGLTKLTYGRIEPNQTRTFSYIITTKAIGNFELRSSYTYYHSTELGDSEFVTISNSILISVIEPLEDFSLQNENVAISFLLILIVLNTILALRIVTPRFNKRKKKT